jgi:hypothetical protein
MNSKTVLAVIAVIAIAFVDFIFTRTKNGVAHEVLFTIVVPLTAFLFFCCGTYWISTNVRPRINQYFLMSVLITVTILFFVIIIFICFPTGH